MTLEYNWMGKYSFILDVAGIRFLSYGPAHELDDPD